MSDKNNYVHTFSVSWDRLHQDSRLLAARLLDRGPFTGIVAVTRGGLVPAAVIARELNIRRIETLCIVSYDWQSQADGRPVVLNKPEGDGSGWLILDDLVDTGRTAEEVRRLLPAGLFATVYAKPAGRDLVDLYVGEVTQETWILFPWDSAVQYVQPLVSKPPSS